MKPLLINVIILIICLTGLIESQRVDLIKSVGPIIEISTGLCIQTPSPTDPPSNYTYLKPCVPELASQQFSTKFSATNKYPDGSFMQGNFDKCVTIFNGGIGLGAGVWGCNAIDFTEWSFRYQDNGFRIINTFYQGTCLSRNETNNSLKLATCGSSGQLFAIPGFSSIALPTPYTMSPSFNPKEIIRQKNGLLDSNGVSSATTYSYTVLTYSLKYENCILSFKKNGVPLWQSLTNTPSGCVSSAYIKILANGNLCTYSSATLENWCAGSNGVGGRYFNVLPLGSYGREWGFVVQTSDGKIVWGQFGAVIMPDAAYNLVPGSYLDALNPKLNKLSQTCLSNGLHFLCINTANGKVDLFAGNPNNPQVWNGAPLIWTTGVTGTLGSYYLTVGLDGSTCVKTPLSTTPLWCAANTAGKGIRYLRLPIFDNTPGEWGIVLQNTFLDLKWAIFNVPIQYPRNHVTYPTPMVITRYHLNNRMQSDVVGLAFDELINYKYGGLKMYNRRNLRDRILFFGDFKNTCPTFTKWEASDQSFSVYFNCSDRPAPHVVHNIQPFPEWQGNVIGPNSLICNTVFPEIMLLNGNGQMIRNYLT